MLRRFHSPTHSSRSTDSAGRRAVASFLLTLILLHGGMELTALAGRMAQGASVRRTSELASISETDAQMACHDDDAPMAAGCQMACSSEGSAGCCCHPGGHTPASLGGLTIAPSGCRGGAAPGLPPYPASMDYRFLEPTVVAFASPAFTRLNLAPSATLPQSATEDLSTPPPEILC